MMLSAEGKPEMESALLSAEGKREMESTGLTSAGSRPLIPILGVVGSHGALIGPDLKTESLSILDGHNTQGAALQLGAALLLMSRRSSAQSVRR